MVVHVGIVLEEDKTHVIHYDTDLDTTNQFEWDEIRCYRYHIHKVKELFDKIIFLIDKQFGCLCVSLDNNYGNNYREEFVECGLHYGFQKVKITNPITVLHLYSLLQTRCFPKDNEILWIINNYICFKWKKFDGELRCTEYEPNADSSEFKDKLILTSKHPDKIIYWGSDKELEESSLKTTFANTHFSLCAVDSVNCIFEGIIIEARMMAKDPNIPVIKIAQFLIFEFLVNLDTKNLITFFADESIPITKSAIFSTTLDNNYLNSWINFNDTEYMNMMYLPSYKRFIVTATIDSNRIFKTDVQLLFADDDSILEIKNKNVENDDSAIKRYYVPQTLVGIIKSVYAQRLKLVVGIDFGTSKCCLAVNRSHGCEAIALDDENKRSLLSYVFYGEENKELCGQIVVKRLQYHSKSSVFDIKRIMGRNYENIVQDKIWPFKLIENSPNVKKCSSMPEKYIYSKKFLLDYHRDIQFQILEKNNAIIQTSDSKKLIFKHPEEIAASLLRNIKLKAEQLQGTHLSDAIITVPASFTKSQKDSIMVAARLAGWGAIHLLPEPVAAAFVYFVDRRIPNDSNILLFDLGAGTLDICIFKIKQNEIEILNTSGDANLGGRDFDKILVKYFENKLQTCYNIVFNENKLLKLLLHCQDIKETLSTNQYTFLDAEEIDPSTEANIKITREDFECLVVELLDRFEICIDNALSKINLQPNQIDKILFVGGSSRMPIIKSILQRKFSASDLLCERHPEEIVAIGAAYYQCYLTYSKEYGIKYNLTSSGTPYKVYHRRKSCDNNINFFPKIYSFVETETLTAEDVYRKGGTFIHHTSCW